MAAATAAVSIDEVTGVRAHRTDRRVRRDAEVAGRDGAAVVATVMRLIGPTDGESAMRRAVHAECAGGAAVAAQTVRHRADWRVAR